MNPDIFEKWFVEMLAILEEPSVVVMDNASYHSVLAEVYPRANARKADIQKWLEKNFIFIGRNIM